MSRRKQKAVSPGARTNSFGSVGLPLFEDYGNFKGNPMTILPPPPTTEEGKRKEMLQVFDYYRDEVEADRQKKLLVVEEIKDGQQGGNPGCSDSSIQEKTGYENADIPTSSSSSSKILNTDLKDEDSYEQFAKRVDSTGKVTTFSEEADQRQSTSESSSSGTDSASETDNDLGYLDENENLNYWDDYTVDFLEGNGTPSISTTESTTNNRIEVIDLTANRDQGKVQKKSGAVDVIDITESDSSDSDVEGFAARSEVLCLSASFQMDIIN